MNEQSLPPTKPISPHPSEKPIDAEPFKGFLLAAYKSLTSHRRSIRLTRNAIIAYILLLVIIPPILITFAFVKAPLQTAVFFNFQVKPQNLAEGANSQVLAASTSNTNKNNALAGYTSSVLEPQAAAAVRTLRVLTPTTVAGICLPGEVDCLPAAGTSQPGPAGTNGAEGIQGLPGLTGGRGTVGNLFTGSGLSGAITDGDLSLNLALASSGGTSTSDSVSGLETTTSGLSLIQGCSNSQVLTWDNGAGLWRCQTPTVGITSLNGLSGGSLSVIGGGITNVTASGSTLTITSDETDTLQSVYDRGNTILTTTGRNIAFTLPDGLALATSMILTNNGSADSLVIDSGATTTGGAVVNGLKITAPKTIPSTGFFNSINLGTSTGAVANTYDQATIAVGSLNSSDQQNLATLNFTNGGSGYLDVEVIRGFINFQGMNQLYDDFTDRVLNTAYRWTAVRVGVDSYCSIYKGGLNGLLRMTAGGASNRSCQISTQFNLNQGFYQRGNNPIVETKLKVSDAANVRIFAGFTDTAPAAGSDVNPGTNHAYIEKPSTGVNFQCVTDDGGAVETVTDTGVAAVTGQFYRLRVEVKNGTTPETVCTVDDGATVIRTVVTATQPSVSSPMDIYLKVETANTTPKDMDVDYVRAWQDDPPVTALSIDSSPLSTSSALITPDSPTLAETPELISSQTDFLSQSYELLISWLADATNGIKDFIANRIHTKTICLGEPGDETCITKTQLDQILQKTGVSALTPTPTPDPSSTPAATLTPAPAVGSGNTSGNTPSGDSSEIPTPASISTSSSTLTSTPALTPTLTPAAIPSNTSSVQTSTSSAGSQ